MNQLKQKLAYGLVAVSLMLMCAMFYALKDDELAFEELFHDQIFSDSQLVLNSSELLHASTALSRNCLQHKFSSSLLHFLKYHSVKCATHAENIKYTESNHFFVEIKSFEM